MTRSVIPFTDFSGGDSGRERPAAGDLTRYRGINTWRYPSGGFGPRPALLAFTYTGLPTGKTLRTFTTAVSSGGTWLAWSFSDGTVYSTVPGGTVAALRGTLTNDPTDAVAFGDSVMFVSNAGTGGGAVESAGTFLAIGTPIADLIVQHRDQTLALRQSDSKLYWSAPDDPTLWPAGNVQFVGDQRPANGMYVQRSTLVITKFNGEVWVYTGTFGVNEVLRKVDVGLIHPFAGAAKGAVCGNSVIYYTTGSKMSAWTGAQLKTLSRPDMPYTAGYNSSPKTDNVGAVTSTGEPNEFVVAGTMDNTSAPTTRLPWFHHFSPDRGWTRHTFPASAYTISSAAMGGLTSEDSAKALRVAENVNGALIFCRPSDSAGSSALAHYIFIPRLETPYTLSVPMQWGTGFSLNDGDTGAPVSATFQSGEYWSPDGAEVTVRSLVVDYEWDADAALTPIATYHSFDLSVEALQRQDGSSQDSATTTFVPATSTSYSIDGGSMRRGRKVFSFGDQGTGGGFRWKLANWRGIVIHSVQAVVDSSAPRI